MGKYIDLIKNKYNELENNSKETKFLFKYLNKNFRFKNGSLFDKNIKLNEDELNILISRIFGYKLMDQIHVWSHYNKIKNNNKFLELDDLTIDEIISSENIYNDYELLKPNELNDIIYNKILKETIEDIFENMNYNYYERLSSKTILNLIVTENTNKDLIKFISRKISEKYLLLIVPILEDEIKNNLMIKLGVTNWEIHFIGLGKMERNKLFINEIDSIRNTLLYKLDSLVEIKMVEKTEKLFGIL